MSRQNHLSGKRVWITGASSGIGKAVAIELARRGAKLAISARNEDALKEVADTIGESSTLILPFDVTDKQQNQNAVKQIEHHWGSVDIVFFNAGTAEYVDINNFSSDVFERTIKTNYLSMVYGIEAVLPLLRNSTSPQLGGMSSTVAFAGVPRAEAYGASKSAIRNMLQALRIHLIQDGIDVFTVCPGFARTPLTDKNDFPMPMRIEVDAAAKIIVDGIAKRKQEIHFPKLFSWIYKFLSYLPSEVYTRLMLKTVKQS